jgi:hypothetical protein
MNLEKLGLFTPDLEKIRGIIRILAHAVPSKLDVLAKLDLMYKNLLKVKSSGAIMNSTPLNDKTNVIIADCGNYIELMKTALQQVATEIELTIPSTIRSGYGNK